MKKILNISLVITICWSVIGCSSLRFPGVYRIAVMQGNYIEQEMIDQIEVGMTRRQVSYVMGTPLVEDPFNPQRWDYYFDLRKDNKLLRDYHFTVFFDDNDKLARWEGDYEPSKVTQKEAEEEALKKTQQREDAKFK